MLSYSIGWCVCDRCLVSLFSVWVDGICCGICSGCRLFGIGISVVWMLMGIFMFIGLVGVVSVVCMVSFIVLMVVLVLCMWKVVLEMVLSIVS